MCASGPVGCFADHPLVHGCVEHRRDRAEAVLGLKGPPLLPTEHGGAVDQEHLLHVAVLSRCVEELLERGGEQVESVVTLVDDRRGGEVGLYLVEHRTEEVLLVGEVVVERATGPDLGLGDDLFGPGREVALGDEELARCVNECGAGRLTLLSLPP